MKYFFKTTQKLRLNLNHSLRGLAVATKEHSVQVELFTVIPLLFLLFLSEGSLLLKISTLIILVLLISIEILNTAIERLSDRVTKAHDPLIRDVKDLSSAAVFLMVVIYTMLCCALLYYCF